MLSHVSEDSTKIKYHDIIIANTINSDHKKQPALSYECKGNVYYSQRKFKLAADNYILANLDAEKKQDKKLIHKTKFNLGLMKSRLGKHEEAAEIFDEYYEYIRLKYQKNASKFRSRYLTALFAKSETYTKLEKLDSASILNINGIQISLKNNLHEMNNYFVLNEGVNLFFKKQYRASIDSLDKTLPFLEKTEDHSNVLYANIYLGKTYAALGEIENSLRHYTVADQLLTENTDFGPEIRDSYKFLIKYYNENGEIENQLKYLEKLIDVDSILRDNYQQISNNVINKYDTLELLRQKENIIRDLNSTNNKSNSIASIAVIIIILLTTTIIYDYRKKKNLKLKFKKHIEEKNEEEIDKQHKTKKTEENISDIPMETVDRIKQGLAKLEKENGYLKKNITLSSLSESFNTNPRYLSRVINFLKGKKITDYINDLRVDYAINKLKKDKKFRTIYTIKAISENVGFSNPVSFSQAFYRKIGMKPSFFIKELKKNQ